MYRLQREEEARKMVGHTVGQRVDTADHLERLSQIRVQNTRLTQGL